MHLVALANANAGDDVDAADGTLEHEWLTVETHCAFPGTGFLTRNENTCRRPHVPALPGTGIVLRVLDQKFLRGSHVQY
jgi:hypothetical protein